MPGRKGRLRSGRTLGERGGHRPVDARRDGAALQAHDVPRSRRRRSHGVRAGKRAGPDPAVRGRMNLRAHQADVVQQAVVESRQLTLAGARARTAPRRIDHTVADAAGEGLPRRLQSTGAWSNG
jgi:hypothetical protein